MMASHGARADPVAGREESRDSAESSIAPASACGVDIGRDGVGFDALIPPGDPEIAERWWEKVEDVLNLVCFTLENRLKYVAFLFMGNALIWWRSVKRVYKSREITWVEFQREFDDKNRPKMYRDKKRMENLNLVQGDEQTVAEYELHFATLAKYALKAVVTQEDRRYHFE
ncbi:UNVERIFIED_CONTAM: hypothetical protein Sangu_2885200 [Sesamum angustifolium]|uniref:Retrotransposon gag domain-containing protein n=1 Tax=Sesamum angustifolium TaxID=2727405 RepID=A0AAW2IN07_9LAMI